MTVEEKVRTYFMEIAKVKEDEIDMRANLFTHYGLDSVKAIKIISDIEVEYDIDISDEEAQGIATLEDVIALIREKSGLE
jgi:acyl carrier protein